ncbi:MAG: hypothetical protein AB7I01_05255 [Gammaproteobacteria bacterium]
MKLGILTALAGEAARLPPRDARLLGAHSFISAIAGPGQARAEAGARRLREQGAEALIAFGVAGGLDPSLRAGDLVVGSSIRNADGRLHDCAPPLVAALVAALAPLTPRCAPLASLPSPVTDSVAKRALHTQHGCVAVDMESAGLAVVAAEFGLPCAALRVVIDPADFSLPRAALAGMGEDGETHAFATALAVLRRPWELAALLRLALWYGAALRGLAAAGAALAAPGHAAH